MDVHPPKNGINRYWSIPRYRIIMRFTLMFCHLTRYQGRLDPQASFWHGTHGRWWILLLDPMWLMWVKQCNFYHPWLGMVSLYHLYKWWWLGDGKHGSQFYPTLVENFLRISGILKDEEVSWRNGSVKQKDSLRQMFVSLRSRLCVRKSGFQRQPRCGHFRNNLPFEMVPIPTNLAKLVLKISKNDGKLLFYSGLPHVYHRSH